MLTSPLILNHSAAQQPSRLADIGSLLKRAVLFLVMPFQSTAELPPPRHLAQTVGLLQRAAELEKSDPDAAARLRWMASSYYC